jgi:hypothetical protein
LWFINEFENLTHHNGAHNTKSVEVFFLQADRNKSFVDSFRGDVCW